MPNLPRKFHSAQPQPAAFQLAGLPDAFLAAGALPTLHDRYGISRETFYVWKRRREIGGERWFEEQSRAPARCPHAIAPEEVAAW